MKSIEFSQENEKQNRNAELKDIYEKLDFIFEITHLPMVMFINNEVNRIFPHFDIEKSHFKFGTAFKDSSPYERLLSSCIAIENYFSGVVNISTIPNAFLVIGPVSEDHLSDEYLLKTFSKFGITSDGEDFIKFFRTSKPISFSLFCRYLIMINYIINGVIQRIESLNVKEKIVEEKYISNADYDISDYIAFYVKNGSLEAFENFYLSNKKCLLETLYDKNSAKMKEKYKNYVSLIYHSLLGAAFSEDFANQIISHYVQAIEEFDTAQSIERLLHELIRVATSAVEKEKKGQHTNASLLYQCDLYIKERIYSRIKVSEMAEYLFYDRSILSRKFKKESGGITISQYILNCKLNKSKLLLRTSNYTINEISALLAFSDQSHFQLQFKKCYGMTPLEFRNRK